MDHKTATPIAVIGLSCRFPGGANSPDRLWELCANARNTWSEWPRDRLNEKAFFHPQPGHRGTFNSKGGHFLKDNISEFDASFFNFTTEMAKGMDPQIRLLLETVFEGFETAGLSLEDVAGSETCVFAGAIFRDYHDILMKDTENLSRYFLTADTPSMVSNRISHFFDLRGTSITVDTACSTSSTALHLACQSLTSGESKMAVVGGANLLLHPGPSLWTSSLGLLGPEGKSHGFDSRADGYGRGEGVACVILKPLEDALRDGDPIRGVIRSTDTNQDGRTLTVTTPSQDAQERVIRSCYKRAGLDPKDTTYVEAHGTGTVAGDTIELNALGNVFGDARSLEDPLYVGSIKANLGHLESTSGLAGVIKVILMLEHQRILPHALFDQPNPRLNLEQLKVKIPSELIPWPYGRPLRASISNFGAGGTNTHVIIEAIGSYMKHVSNGTARPEGASDVDSRLLPDNHIAKNYCQDHPTSKIKFGSDSSRYLFTLSAKDKNSLQDSARQLCLYLDTINGRWTVPDLAYTLTQRRSHLSWRMAVSAGSFLELKETLDSSASLPIQSLKAPRLGFVFTGQGAQWHAMGRELIATYPVFEEALQQADSDVRSFGADWSVLEELYRDQESSKVNDPRFSFPLTVIIQLALTRLLKSWGVLPTATTGHSSGEIAAAYAAGALNFREAIAVAYIRGQLTSNSVATGRLKGGMIAVAVGKEKAAGYLESLKSGTAVIACVNSPLSVTISGDLPALKEIKTRATGDETFARLLKVPAAYHSPEMRVLVDDYVEALQPYLELSHPDKCEILFSSPVDGQLVRDRADLRKAAHWAQNMVQCVLFEDALREIILGGGTHAGQALSPVVDVVIEIGPHGALQGPIRQILSDKKMKDMGIDTMSCLSRGKSAIQTMQDLAGRLHNAGYPVDLKAVNFPGDHDNLKVIHDLPYYQWNHSVGYWTESSLARDFLQREHASHDLLGVRVEGLSPDQATWRNTIRVSDLPWVVDHSIQSETLFPGVGLMVMVIEAMQQLAGGTDEQSPDAYILRDIDLFNGLVVPETPEGLEIQLTIYNANRQLLDPDSHRDFAVYSRSGSGVWSEHCRGKVAPTSGRPKRSSRSLDSENCAPIDIGTFYDYLDRVGPTVRRHFRNITSVAAREGHAVATVTVPDIDDMMPFPSHSRCWIHPTTFDACFHPQYVAAPESLMRKLGLCIPTFTKSVYIHSDIRSRAGRQLKVTADLDETSHQGFKASMCVSDMADPYGSPLLKIDGVNIRSLAAGQMSDTDSQTLDQPLFLQSTWQPDLSLMSETNLQKRIVSEPDAEEAALLADLHRAALNVIHDALVQLTPEEERDLEWYHVRLVSWMRRQDTLLYAASAVEDKGEKDELLERVARKSSNGRLLCLVAENLLSFLRKTADPVEVMFKDDFLYRFYPEALKFKKCLDHVERYMSLHCHKYPKARILEVGAGTGVCTTAVVKALSGANSNSLTADHYDYTDISTGFFEAAQKKFQVFSSQMRYRTFNAEHEITEQGFEEANYDLVIACNVLHATTSLKQTLRNVRKLLKVGGRIIIVETTTPHVDVSLAFGLFPGWWLSEEEERKWSPLVDLSTWKALLEDTGFGGLDVTLQDSDCPSESNYSAMVATAQETVDHPASIQHPSISLVVDQKVPSAWIDCLGQSLTELTAATVSVAQLGDSSLGDRTCIFLQGLEDSTLPQIDTENFDRVKEMLQSASNIIWISRGTTYDVSHPEAALHIGLLRTLRLEEESKKYISLDLDPVKDLWTQSMIEIICDVYSCTLRSAVVETQDYEFTQRDDHIMVPRLSSDPLLNDSFNDLAYEFLPQQKPFSFNGPYMRLEASVPGMLDSLVFKEDDNMLETIPWSDSMVEIQPHAFGLNFRDVFVAMGQMQEGWMGFECAGYISKVGQYVPGNLKVGSRVCALMTAGHWANKIRVPWTGVVPLPDEMSFQTAASIPLAYVTAVHALMQLARLEPNERVLIHSAAGGVGQAAIAIAQYIGAEAFATVGSEEKRSFLVQTYGIPEDHIFSSRDASFAEGIMEYTAGQGVDVILNSLSGPLLQASWNCLATLGRFIELGKRDSQQNKYLEMAKFSQSVMYASMDVVQLPGRDLSRALGRVFEIFQDKKIIHRSPITTYSISELQRAFRLLQSGKLIGKAVIEIHEGENVQVLAKQKPLRLRSDASYLIVGVCGIGCEVARWMAQRGAGHLILISRNAEQLDIHELRAEAHAAGSHVIVRNCDITDKAQLQRIIGECDDRFPIRGVIQAAAVLQDSVFSNMTQEQWQAAVRPKYEGTKNLDEAFPGTCLDFFVILSSVTGIVGNLGQGNYTGAGTYQDALARHRTMRGQPAVSINLGGVVSVGVAARGEKVLERLQKAGFRNHELSEVLRIIELAIEHPHHGQILTGIEPWTTPGELRWRHEPRFAGLWLHDGPDGAETHAATTSSSLRDCLAKSSATALPDVLIDALTSKMADMFAVPPASIDANQPLSAYGVDSLVAVELRNWLAHTTPEVSIFDVTQSSSLRELAGKVAEKYERKRLKDHQKT